MICCKCKKPIERSYGRVTDLGNYCRECAMQNEIEAEKSIVAVVKQIIDETRKETAEKILNDLYHREELGFETIKWYAKEYWGIEIKE